MIDRRFQEATTPNLTNCQATLTSMTLDRIIVARTTITNSACQDMIELI